MTIDDLTGEQDPDLWFRDANCLVHLYAKGQSRRGPSFKVPFSTLLDSECLPLIVRFLPADGPRSRPRSPRELKRWGRLDLTRSVELYIAPSALANREQTFQYHLATRNFFAWAFGKPLVGTHLGQAMISLLNSMHEFRSDLGQNVTDMLAYLEQQGYLDITGHPSLALAVLHFAEHFQLRELYVRAFAHCVGMSERLHFSTEYQVS